MSSLGHSPVPGAGAGAGLGANQILQPTIPGGANPSNAHFTNQYGSIVGGVRGCAGAGGSAAALAGHPGYNIVPKSQSGGYAHRRGGKSKKRSCKCRGKCRCRRGGKSKKRSGNKRSGNKRSMRGGLSALSPGAFSGAANAPYQQFLSNQPVSFNFGLGSPSMSYQDSALASPPPRMDIQNNCGSNHGLVGKGLLN
jgi:hypothetical protein